MINRTCGDCSLCCKLVPVKGIEKPRNRWCEHCTKPGCAIYDTRPRECAAWSCGWLLSNLPESLKPRRCHVVIDVVAEVVKSNVDDGPFEEWHALQIWVDPAYPAAYRNTELLDYLARLCEQEGFRAVIVRTGNPEKSLLLFAPHFTGQGWVERPPQPQDRNEFTEAQRWEAAKLGYAGAEQ